MQWIKTISAKRWNCIHGSLDHLWGDRYFARAIKDPQDYYNVMSYIDNNPVKAGFVDFPAEWKASGAFYKARNIDGMVDFLQNERVMYVRGLMKKGVWTPSVYEY